ncbi:MAG: menaquinol oxidoreductase [Deferribacteres bacterium]|nr:menaquinol oxidoreductase [Deferribacteres bacterium]
MYDGGKIIIGLIIFLAIVTFPFYSNIGKANVKPAPDLNTPAIQELEEKKCIEPTGYMRANHMKLLKQWMDDLQEFDKDTYKASDCKVYDSSYDTCMECHVSQKNFCDRCHTYAAVKPYCWECHELD